MVLIHIDKGCAESKKVEQETHTSNHYGHNLFAAKLIEHTLTTEYARRILQKR